MPLLLDRIKQNNRQKTYEDDYRLGRDYIFPTPRDCYKVQNPKHQQVVAL